MIIEKNRTRMSVENRTRMRLIEQIITDTFKDKSVVYPSNPFYPCSIKSYVVVA